MDWRFFSLEQVNTKDSEAPKVWERSEEAATSLVAFKASAAARRQSPDNWEPYHEALLLARHEHKEDLDRPTVLRVAGDVGLDPAQVERDMAEPTIVDSLARDHEEAVAQGVFGCPTIHFEEGGGAYLRMMPANTGPEAARVFDTFRQIVAGDLNIQEIKRPKQ